MKAFLFPGQGSQSKEMGGTLFDEFNELTHKADKILGYSVKELCLEDPEKQLNQTQFTQPALYVVNALSYYKKIEETGQKPDFAAGHSLGEFNALLAAECYDFEVGLKLVKKRGELMSQAADGGMAAILNASKENIEGILKENGLTNIDLANYNTPSQIVISGLRDEIEKAQALFQEGDMLYIPLNTSGAFHSRYMASARDEFETYLKEFKFSDLKIGVISNFSAKPYQDDDIIINLANQINNPVRWSDSIQYLMGLGDMEFEEIGHGNVLTKMVRKIKQEKSNTIEDTAGKLNVKEDEIVQVQEIENDQRESNEESRSLTAEEKVNTWNQHYPIGTRVKSTIMDDDNLETRTEAVVLFGHRAAIYMKDYNGYFDLDETIPLEGKPL
jgi:malonyl CoA-acyl carrier protein transacylase